MNAIDFFKEEDPGNNNEYSKDTNNWLYDKNDMVMFAERYHQAKLKLLGIANVVGRSEQLVCESCGTPDQTVEQGRCSRCWTSDSI